MKPVPELIVKSNDAETLFIENQEGKVSMKATGTLEKIKTRLIEVSSLNKELLKQQLFITDFILQKSLERFGRRSV